MYGAVLWVGRLLLSGRVPICLVLVTPDEQLRVGAAAVWIVLGV